MTPPYDLVIRAGRLFCARSGLDGPGGVAVREGRIQASGPAVSGPARQELSFPDDLLLPGLVDAHAHPARGGSKFGVDPDLHMLPRGVTTVLSQGDAGAAGWPAYRDGVVGASRTRVLLAIHLSRSGESRAEGCFERLDDADVEACVAAVQAARRQGSTAIWGIAVNTSLPACGRTDPREVLRRGLEAAERTGLPLLFGSRRQSDWPLEEQLPLLRPGDVVTYCYSPDPDGILREGRVREAAWAARDRGVLFDLGHGMASFSFAVAEAAVAQGFPPDTLSSDYYARHVGLSPPHDLPRTVAKMMAAGLAEADALERVTARPAALLGLAGAAGTLEPGAGADLTVLRWRLHGAPLRDTLGCRREGGCWEPLLTVRAGEPVRPAAVPERLPGHERSGI